MPGTEALSSDPAKAFYLAKTDILKQTVQKVLLGADVEL